MKTLDRSPFRSECQGIVIPAHPGFDLPATEYREAHRFWSRETQQKIAEDGAVGPIKRGRHYVTFFATGRDWVRNLNVAVRLLETHEVSGIAIGVDRLYDEGQIRDVLGGSQACEGRSIEICQGASSRRPPRTPEEVVEQFRQGRGHV